MICFISFFISYYWEFYSTVTSISCRLKRYLDFHSYGIWNNHCAANWNIKFWIKHIDHNYILNRHRFRCINWFYHDYILSQHRFRCIDFIMTIYWVNIDFTALILTLLDFHNNISLCYWSIYFTECKHLMKEQWYFTNGNNINSVGELPCKKWNKENTKPVYLLSVQLHVYSLTSVLMGKGRLHSQQYTAEEKKWDLISV